MDPSRSVLGAAESNDFDYTFTNQELEDVLGFLERKQTGIDLDQGSLPFSGPLSLQFQPRPEASIASLQLTSYDTSAAAYTAAAPAAAPLPLMHMQPPDVGGFVQQVPVNGGAEQLLHVEQEPTNSRQQPAAAGGSGGATARRDGKPVMSHSSVEKQRRDRINSLIDELRDLVPPQPVSAALGAGEGGDHQQQQHGQHSGGSAGQGGGDHGQGRRPKHVVLADTITLVKGMRERVALDEQRIAQLQDHQVHCPFTTLDQHQHHQQDQQQQQPAGSAGSGSASEASAAVAAVGVRGASAAAGGSLESSAESVEVEEGSGCLFVKVHCRDRHGLLSDIVRTLKSIPVEITTAAITTTHSGNVYDVFQVTPAPGTPTALKEEIIASVHGVMASATVEKKRRAE